MFLLTFAFRSYRTTASSLDLALHETCWAAKSAQFIELESVIIHCLAKQEQKKSRTPSTCLA